MPTSCCACSPGVSRLVLYDDHRLLGRSLRYCPLQARPPWRAASAPAAHAAFGAGEALSLSAGAPRPLAHVRRQLVAVDGKRRVLHEHAVIFPGKDRYPRLLVVIHVLRVDGCRPLGSLSPAVFFRLSRARRRRGCRLSARLGQAIAAGDCLGRREPARRIEEMPGR